MYPRYLFLFLMFYPVFAFRLSLLRICIDKIDDKIIILLRKRIELAKCTRQYKKNIRDFSRETEIISRLKSKKIISAHLIDQIYPSIFNETRHAQDN